MRVQHLWSHVVVLALGTAFLHSAASAERIAATFCVTVGVELEQTDALTSRLDDFARRSGLTYETGDPGGRFYFNEDGSEMVALRNGMAEFGSVLAYVPMKKNAPSELADRLGRFVAERIAPDYETTHCEDIEGFSMPAIHR